MGVTNTFTLIKDSRKEGQAVVSIVDLYMQNDESNQKTPNQLMSLLLDTITAAVSTVPNEEKNEDSDSLVEFNKFINGFSEGYRNNQPQLGLINGNLETAIDVLHNIARLAGENTFTANRLNEFASRIESQKKSVLDKIQRDIEKAEEEESKSGLSFLFYIGLLILFISFFFFDGLFNIGLGVTIAGIAWTIIRNMF